MTDARVRVRALRFCRDKSAARPAKKIRWRQKKFSRISDESSHPRPRAAHLS
jgi:hypothetical protein